MGLIAGSKEARAGSVSHISSIVSPRKDNEVS